MKAGTLYDGVDLNVGIPLPHLGCFKFESDPAKAREPKNGEQVEPYFQETDDDPLFPVCLTRSDRFINWSPEESISTPTSSQQSSSESSVNTGARINRGEDEVPIAEEDLLSDALEDPFALEPTKDTIKDSAEALSPFVKGLLRTHTEKNVSIKKEQENSSSTANEEDDEYRIFVQELSKRHWPVQLRK